jgi:tetratricopeptide (TPR) repeat protein
MLRCVSLVPVGLVFLVAVGCGATAGDAGKVLAKGEEAYRKGDFDASVRCCTEAIKLKPDFAKAYCDRGLAYGRRGDFDRGIADCAEAIRLKPGFAEAYCSRGVAYGLKGEIDKAIADYTEAVRLKPDYSAAYHNRGVAYRLKGNLTKAQADIARARELRAQGPESRRIVAAISAPIVYENLLLVLSNEHGVAAITFTSEIEDGVRYRYRYLPKDGKEECGEGEVFEKYRRLPGNKPGEVRVLDGGGKLSLQAGPLKVTWSFAQKGKGYIYYFPECVHVQIASARDFEKIELTRFMVGRFSGSSPPARSTTSLTPLEASSPPTGVNP